MEKRMLEIYEAPSQLNKFQYELCFCVLFFCILSQHTLVRKASFEMLASQFV